MLFLFVGIASAMAVALGLFARDVIGSGFANSLLFGGFVVGCLNLSQHLLAKMLKNNKKDCDTE
jgi:hypothetical protein